MEQEKLKQLQETELGILEEVASLCEKHDLAYFLDSGTLLGAIRHNGFIPWDDDIDITMPAPDYYRFLEIAQKELGEKYFVQTFYTDENYDRGYAKVRLNGTLVRPAEVKEWHVHQGAWIDIFPMFYADKEKEVRTKRSLYKLVKFLQAKDSCRNYILTCGKTPSLILQYFLASIIDLIPLNLRIQLHRRIIDTIFSKAEGQYLVRCGYRVIPFDKDYYLKEKCYHQFEHLSLRIPNGFETILRIDYGDYMVLPPEDKRGSHGEIEVEV